MLRYVVGMMVTFVVATAALCGGGSGTATPVSDEEFLAAAKAAVGASLLSLNDFPVAWNATPPEPDEDDPAGDAAFREALSPQCQENADLFDDSGATYPGSVFEKESDTFEPDNVDGPPNDVSSDGATFRTGESLDEEWEKGTSFLERCGDELPDAVRSAFATDPELAEVELTEIKFNKVDAPDLGDRAARWEMSMVMETQGLTFEATIVTTNIQVGRMVGSVTWTDFGDFDKTLGESLTALVADRLAKADDTLPE